MPTWRKEFYLFWELKGGHCGWKAGNEGGIFFFASRSGVGVGGHCFFLEYLEALVCHETRHGRYLSKSLLHGLSPAYKKHLGCSASVD